MRVRPLREIWEHYRCATCRKWYLRPSDSGVSCCVNHHNECCHAFEIRATKKGWPKETRAPERMGYNYAPSWATTTR